MRRMLEICVAIALATAATATATAGTIYDPVSGRLVSTLRGAAALSAGAGGAVPAPAAGDQAKVLFGDGSWGALPDSYLLNTGDSGTGVYDFGSATSVELPNSADPAVTAIGQFAVDTTDNALIGFDGTAERVYAHPVSHFSFTIYADGAWASESVPVWQAPKDMAITIVQVNATVTGTGTPTLAYNIEEVAWGGLASAGTDVFSADVTAVAAGLESTSFNNPGIAAKAHLVFTTGATPDSGTVSLITVTVYYTRVVE